MAHTTLIGGTAYEIGGGKTLIGGTEYSVAGGITRVGGANYDIGFGPKVIDGEIRDSWRTIASGRYLWAYSIGNWKPITLSTGQTIIMEIVAFNVDSRPDGSYTNITWISRGFVAKRPMNDASVKFNPWETSSLRTWLRGDFYQTLPSELTSVIGDVVKLTSSIIDGERVTAYHEENVWILSSSELGASGCYLDYFPNTVSLIKYDSGGTAYPWWCRSMNNVTDDNARYHVITPYGYQSADSSTQTFGVVIGFCT